MNSRKNAQVENSAPQKMESHTSDGKLVKYKDLLVELLCNKNRVRQMKFSTLFDLRLISYFFLIALHSTARSENGPPPTLTVNVTPAPVPYNGIATIAYVPSNNLICYGNFTAPGNTPVNLTIMNSPGSVPLPNLRKSGTVTIQCVNTITNQSISVSRPVTVAPPPPPTLTVNVTPAIVPYNGAATIAYVPSNDLVCYGNFTAPGNTPVFLTIMNSPGSVPLPNLRKSGTVTIQCVNTITNQSISVSRPVTVAPPPPPTLTVNVTPATVPYNGTATIAYVPSNDLVCYGNFTAPGDTPVILTIMNSPGSVPLPNLRKSGTVTIQCVNTITSQSISVSRPVTVAPQAVSQMSDSIFHLSGTQLFGDMSDLFRAVNLNALPAGTSRPPAGTTLPVRTPVPTTGQFMVPPGGCIEQARYLNRGESLCRFIDERLICESEYIPNRYACGNFAKDFCIEASRRGVNCRVVRISCARQTLAHVASVIEVESPVVGYQKYCWVEPQTNEIKACYLVEARNDSSVPPQASSAITAGYRHLNSCTQVVYDWRAAATAVTIREFSDTRWPISIPQNFLGTIFDAH